MIDRDQLAAADRYHKLYRRSFGLPNFGGCLLNDRAGAPAMSDDALERARRELDAMVARLSPEQKLQIDNLVISGWLPQWFYAAKLGWRAMPSDDRERDALATGLVALSRADR